MKCVNHPETEAVAICINCLNPFCPDCSIKVEEKNYCRSCVSKALKTSGETKQKRSVKVTIAGILCIIVGVLGVIGGISYISKGVDKEFWYETTNWTQIGYGIACIVTSIMSFIGGIYALTRKSFGLAIAGATCAVLPGFFLGIPALILIAFSKNDFDSQREEPIKTADQFKPEQYYSRDPFNRGDGTNMF